MYCLAAEVAEVHVVALAVPAVAAPGEAVLGEGIVNIAALGDGVRINICLLYTSRCV